MFLKHTLKLIISSALVAHVPTYSFAKSTTSNGNGNPFDCSNNPQLCTGNSGNGVGNTGPGNQGNDKPVGNAGGSNGTGGETGSGGNNSGGGSSSNNGGGSSSNNGGGASSNNGGGSSSNNGGGNSGGANTGNNGSSSGNPFDCDNNPNLCTGNNGNGNGNTGPGNQGNDKPVGNAGGDNNGGGNNGGGNNGGGDNGGGDNGGGDNGGGDNGGGDNGGGGNGGGDNGGGDNGGGDNGGGDNGGGDNGGGDNGGGNNGGGDSDNGNGSDDGGSDDGGKNDDDKGSDDGKNDDDKQDDSPAKKEEKKKKELKAKLLPAFYLDFDSGNKIINITPHNPRKANNSLVKTEFNASSDTLVYGDYLNGFQVTTYSRLEGGVGANVAFYYENATGLQSQFWATVGLIPYVGREMVSNRYAPLLTSAHAKPSLKIPLTADVLNTWTVGDNTTHASKGGIIFFAGPGIGPVGASMSYVANGIFQTYVEKVDADHALVRLTDIDVNRVGVQVGATLTSVGTTKYKEVAKAFSYLISFKDPVGAKAYSDLVRGNVAAIQKLANQGNGAVQKWDKMTRTQVGRINHFFFGFPIILNTVWTAGKVYELSNTQTLFDDTLTTVQYGVYLKDKRSRLITTHSSVTQAFYGGIVKIQPKNTTAMKAYFGQYSWTAEDDSTNHRDIRSDIKGLVQKTGLKKELTLNIPTLKDLEFSQVAFKMNLNEETTLRLMNAIANSSEQYMASLADKKATAYFANKSDAWELCPINQDSADSCMDTQINSARYSSKQLYKAALNMKAHYRAGRDKEFTAAYADFGKALLASPFVFQSFLQVAGAGLEMEYIVNSTYFSSYHIKLTTTATPGAYVKSFVPTYAFAPNLPIDSGAARGGALVPPAVSPIVSP